MPRVKAFNEKDVLTKAMNLFWKQGYAATSVQDLVLHLGINRASLYDTFGDKEQLFLKAFNHYRTTNEAAVKTFLASQSDVKQGLSLLFKSAIDDAVNDKDCKGCFVVNATTELIPNNEQFSKIIEKNWEDFQAIFFDTLEKGKSAGQLPTDFDSKTMAQLLFTLYNGIRVVSKVKPNKEALTKSVDMVLSLLKG